MCLNGLLLNTLWPLQKARQHDGFVGLQNFLTKSLTLSPLTGCYHHKVQNTTDLCRPLVRNPKPPPVSSVAWSVMYSHSVSGERLLLQTPTLLSSGCLCTGYVFQRNWNMSQPIRGWKFAQAKLSGGLQEKWINNTAVLYDQVERYPLPRPNTLSLSCNSIKIIYLKI